MEGTRDVIAGGTLLRVRQLLLLQDRNCYVAVTRMTKVAAVVAAGKAVLAAPGQKL